MATGLELHSILAALELEPAGDNRYRGRNIQMGHDVVFGGQLMAQSIVAAAQGHDDKHVKTLHTVFARGGVNELPLEIEVDPVSRGRSIAVSTVTISQEGRVCTRSMVLLSADEPDIIRHSDPAPGLRAPSDGGGREEWEINVVDDVDINDPDAVGPAELDVWTRFPGAPDEPVVNQALLGFATDGFLIGTAMRPHVGVGQAQAHRTLSTGVLSHTITFHEPFSAASWLLLSHRSPYAGRGRSYGNAAVYGADGRLVASYVQDNMIRAKAGAGPL